MENNEIFISIESSLNNLFYNNDFDYVTFYINLHNYSIEIQKVKYTNIRGDMIKFYRTLLNKFTTIIDTFISNMFHKINNDDEKLKVYNYEFIIYNNNLEIIDKIAVYINTQLINYDINNKQINYINYGNEKWINGVTINLSNYITDKIINNINFYNEEKENEEEIYYITEILDNLYNNVSNIPYIKSNFTDVIEKHLNNSINNLLNVLHNNTGFLKLIDTFNKHYLKHLTKLNLNYMIGKYNYLFKTRVLDKYEPHIKKDFLNSLTLIVFDRFKLTHTIVETNITLINICIEYCDNISLKTIYYNWFNNLSSDKSSSIDNVSFEYMCYLKYFSQTICDTFYNYNTTFYNYNTNISQTNIFNVDDIFNTYFIKDKSIIEAFDTYIRTNCYKSKGIPLKSFCRIISWYLNNCTDDEIEDETFYIYYKSYNVKRLYKFNFYKKYVEIELEILNYLIDNVKSPYMHKLNIIKNDMCISKELSIEFNNIYNYNSNLTIMTYGIWGISPSTYNYSNTMFNQELTTLTDGINVFYNCKYSSKQLIWCHDICRCTLNYTINNQIIEIDCPLTYANILYNFNDVDMINNITNQLMDNMVTYKLLIKDNDTYSLNNKFKAKNNKLTIRNSKPIIKKIQKKQMDEIVYTEIELLELYIMRTLKHNQRMSENDILKKVGLNYKNDNDMILNVLSGLVDKSYLSIENNNYNYVV